MGRKRKSADYLSTELKLFRELYLKFDKEGIPPDMIPQHIIDLSKSRIHKPQKPYEKNKYRNVIKLAQKLNRTSDIDLI